MLTYADVWAMMETAGAGTGSKRKIAFSGQGAAEDGQHRQAAGSRGQQEQQAGRENRTAGRQQERAARLPSFLCTNTFVAAFELVPIMYRYRNKDELGNSCALRPTTQ